MGKRSSCSIVSKSGSKNNWTIMYRSENRLCSLDSQALYRLVKSRILDVWRFMSVLNLNFQFMRVEGLLNMFV